VEPDRGDVADAVLGDARQACPGAGAVACAGADGDLSEEADEHPPGDAPLLEPTPDVAEESWSIMWSALSCF